MVSLGQSHASLGLFSPFNVSLSTNNAVPSRPAPSTQSHSPFTSALLTLSESIRDPGQTYITTHDITEAYNLISCRLRTFKPKEPSDIDEASLAVFGTHADSIEQCLSRDIRRMLPNPFDTQTSYPQSYRSQENPDEENQRITNNAHLCCYAVRLVQDIFSLPSVLVHFTDHQLASLLDECVSICTTQSPIMNSKKLYVLVIFLLKTQQLPSSILDVNHVKADITAALKSAICGKVGRLYAQADAFEAVFRILTRNPSFFNAFLDLLPHILENLNTQPMHTKPWVTCALCGFVTAKLHFLDSHEPFEGERAYEIVNNYVNQQTSRRQSLQKSTLLPALFHDALTSTEKEWQAIGPAFGVVVVSCLLVLLDSAFFSSRRAIKLILRAISPIKPYGRRNVRTLYPEVWRVLIWAYTRLPLRDDVTQNDEDASDDDAGLAALREGAFGVLMEEVGDDLGLALIEVLLTRTKEADKAVKVVSALVENKDPKLQEEGLRVMDHLLSHIGASSSSNGKKKAHALSLPFSMSLVDGSLPMQHIRQLGIPSPMRTSLDQIPPLSEEDVANNWPCLSEAWISVAHHHLASDREILPELLRIWQALLLVRSDLTQHQRHHLTAAPTFGVEIAEILNGFLAPVLATNDADRTPEKQARVLSFVGSLWGVVTNVFTMEWLTSPAKAVLAPLLKAEFTLTDERVKEAWSRVCAELMTAGTPSLLSGLHRASVSATGADEEEAKESPELRRHMWNLSAKNILKDPRKEDWQDVLKFLAMPIGVWELSDDDFASWEAIFKAIVDLSVEMAFDDHPVAIFLGHLEESKLNSLRESPRLLWSLLSLSSQHSPSFLDETLLSFVNDIMLSQYPSEEEVARSEGPVPIPVEPLRLIGNFIMGLTESDILGFLSIMEESLSCWIADERGLLDDERHNEIVDAFYRHPLDLLSRLPPTLAALNQTSSFLTSVFSGTVRGEGPRIFHSFWRSTYHICDAIPKKEYPINVKACLKAWGDFCEDSIGDGFSLGSEEEYSVVSDSQPDYAEEDPLDQLTRIWMKEQGGANPHGADAGLGAKEEQGQNEDDDGDVTMQLQLQDNSNFLPDPATPRHRTSLLPPLEDQLPTRGGDGPRSKLKGSVFELKADHLASAIPAPVFRLQTPIKIEVEAQASTSKRTLRGDVDGTRPAKKRRIAVPPIGFAVKPRAAKERDRADAREEALFFASSSQPLPGITVSEPPGRTSHSSDSLRSPEFSSQPAVTPNKTDKSWLQADFSRLGVPGGSAHKSKSRARVTSSPFLKSDDYDSWEKAVSPNSLMQVLGDAEGKLPLLFEDDEDVGDEDGDEEMPLDLGALEGNNGGGDSEDASDAEDLSPSLSKYPIRPRRRDRSQTAPEPDIMEPLERDTPVGQPLRRYRTSPIPDADADTNSDAQAGSLGATSNSNAGPTGVIHPAPTLAEVQEAFARASENMNIEELLAARRALNEVLDERMASKISSKDK